MIRIVIIAAYPLIREGIKSLVQQHSDLHIVGEARFVGEVVTQLQASPPDVVLVSLDQAEETGSAVRDILQLAPAAKVLALSDSAEDVRVINALLAGAKGYISRDLSADDMAHAIRAAHAGLLVLGSAPAEVLLGRLRPLGMADAVEPLTDRELQVLELLVRGLGNRQIAAELGITEHTVKFHIGAILSKLHASNRTEAVSVALQNGLVSL